MARWGHNALPKASLACQPIDGPDKVFFQETSEDLTYSDSGEEASSGVADLASRYTIAVGKCSSGKAAADNLGDRRRRGRERQRHLHPQGRLGRRGLDLLVIRWWQHARLRHPQGRRLRRPLPLVAEPDAVHRVGRRRPTATIPGLCYASASDDRSHHASPHARREDLGRPRRRRGARRADRPRHRPAPRPRGHQPAGLHGPPRARPQGPPPGAQTVATADHSTPTHDRSPAHPRPAGRLPGRSSWSATAPSSASRPTPSARRTRASSTSSGRSWA